MKTISIDIETYSSNSINNGVYKYVEAADFEIILFSYSVDFGKVECVDLLSDKEIPKHIKAALNDPSVLKLAYNAQFEITCLSAYLGYELDVTQWYCTMVYAAQCGLPFGLSNVAKVLNTIDQKDPKGKALIKYFCEPCKPSKVNKGRTRNLPHHDFEKWADFRHYNIKDVETEMSVSKSISWFDISIFEKPIWHLDQKINRKGVKVDLELVNQAIKLDQIYNTDLIAELKRITKLNNPASVAQLKKYINIESGEEIKSLAKSEEDNLKALFKNNRDILHILDLRKRISRTSIKKYHAIHKSVNDDSIVRGLFQYYGARTGRWSGRNVQLQNLKSNTLNDLGIAREAVRKGDLDTIKLLFDDPGEVLSNLIRTVFIPHKKWLIISDFSAIEARIIAWLANEEWRLEVFKGHGKIYEASASKMFKIPIEEVTKETRTKGKIAELALGYQGSVGALTRMGGEKMGLSASEMKYIVNQWRQANRKIVNLWYEVESLVKHTIVQRTQIKTKNGLITFSIKNKNLLITLPSGRSLSYIDINISNDQIVYKGLDDLNKWGTIKSYGGKFVENIVQAIARDILTEKMKELSIKYDVVIHVHDEVVIDSNNDNVEEINKILSTEIDWAKGLPLKCETFVSKYYKK